MQLDPQRIEGQTARKASLSDGDSSPILDVVISAIGKYTSPGWFFDTSGNIRNLKTQLDALVSAIQSSKTITETNSAADTSTIDHQGPIYETDNFRFGTLQIVVTALTGTSFTVRVYGSNDGITFQNTGLAALTVNMVGSFFKDFSDYMGWKYIRIDYIDTVPDVSAYTATEIIHFKG